jgi:hypothetical protein
VSQEGEFHWDGMIYQKSGSSLQNGILTRRIGDPAELFHVYFGEILVGDRTQTADFAVDDRVPDFQKPGDFSQSGANPLNSCPLRLTNRNAPFST